MQPWQFYAKSVGAWTIVSNRSPFQFPLKAGEDTSGPAREYFNYLSRGLEAICDLFSPRYLESPHGTALLKSYAPLTCGEMRPKLMAAWENEARKAGRWLPSALIGGISRVFVSEGGTVLLVELPDVLRLALAGQEDGDRYVLTLATNCDLWLERTLAGGDNASAGPLNAAKLARAIAGLENAMDGKVASYATELEDVDINEQGFNR